MSSVSATGELPIVPQYGRQTLSDLLPSIAYQFGVGDTDRLGLGAGEQWVVVLVDGLGTEQLEQVASRAPFLSGELRRAQVITAGVPSTTVTSLTSLGTGLPPGGHGVAGFTCRLPETDEIVAPLFWSSPMTAREFQPEPTVFEQLAGQGVAVSSVMPSRFEGSFLTVAGLRGGEVVGIDDEADQLLRITRTVEAAERSERSLVYCYERELDHCGHAYGWRSQEWLDCLIRIDRWCSWLRAELPEEVRLIITADHGMVDVPDDRRLVVEAEPDLLAGVRQLAGEARFRQLYLEPGETPRAVARRWADRLGDAAWVRTRDEAVAEGWFGPLSDRVAGRFGDVVVAMAEPAAVLTEQMPGEFDLVGMHGSLSSAEMLVPLLQPE